MLRCNVMEWNGKESTHSKQALTDGMATHGNARIPNASSPSNIGTETVVCEIRSKRRQSSPTGPFSIIQYNNRLQVSFHSISCLSKSSQQTNQRTTRTHHGQQSVLLVFVVGRAQPQRGNDRPMPCCRSAERDPTTMAIHRKN
jgi:hypothetical protein